MMKETLREYVDSRGVKMRVDRLQGVIHGVKILGLVSRNGRHYLAEALVRAVGLYEGAKVNVNHANGSPTCPRDYRDRIGSMRNVRLRPEDGLFADFHFNPKHALAEQLIWDAENSPENVGFSHNVMARTTRRGERTEVEEITKVQSVDLVADPATTQGLFESQPEKTAKENEPSDAANSADNDQSSSEKEVSDDRNADRTVDCQNENEAEKAGETFLAGLCTETLRAERPDLVEELLADSRREIESLNQKLEQLLEADGAAQRQRRIREMLLEFNLPDPETADGSAKALVGGRFMQSLIKAADEEEIRELIKERAELARHFDGGNIRVDKTPFAHGKPLSQDQFRVEETINDTDSFVKAIT